MCADVGVGLVVVAAQWVSSLRRVSVACSEVVTAGPTCLEVVAAAAPFFTVVTTAAPCLEVVVAAAPCLEVVAASALCLAVVPAAAPCLTAPGMGDGSTSLISSTPSARASPPSWLRRLRNGVGDKCVLGGNRDVGAAGVCAAALVMVW